MPKQLLILRQLGIQPYADVARAMHLFTDQRNTDSADEIWLVQHPAIFTQGQAGKTEHLLSPGDIPVIQSDRGGQVTYHAPGQQVMYTLINLKRLKLNVRELVTHLENSVIAVLAQFGIQSHARPDAPGVYTEQKKICSLGLRIRKGCSLHGLALNVNMDLSPFSRINPCGYAGLEMTQVSTFIPDISVEEIAALLVQTFVQQLGYSAFETYPWNLHDYE